MRNQSPVAVFFLTLITFGIYYFFWFARTRGEMNAKGSSIPTTWLLIVPFVNLYYLWKWSEGVESVTGGKMGAAISFMLILFLNSIGMAVIQDAFNNAGENSVAQQPTPFVAQTQPQVSEATVQQSQETPSQNNQF